MGLPEALPAEERAGERVAQPCASRRDIVPAELRLRLLRTPQEISTIEHLRRQIRLPVEVTSSPGFTALEKKETSSGSWRRSCGASESSAP